MITIKRLRHPERDRSERLPSRHPEHSALKQTHRRVYATKVMMNMQSISFTKDRFSISTDRSKLDISVIHGFLSKSYWAEEIPKEIVQKAIDNSLCFGVYNAEKLVGFARVITDYATFGYLADVFIIDSERGKGLSKWLMECMLLHPQLQGLRNFCLMTQDAHSLYERYGFKNIPKPENFMAKKIEGIYKKKKAES